MSGLRFRLSARVRKLLLSLFAVVIVVYFAFAAFIWRTMHQPPEAFGRVMANMPGPVVFLFFPFERPTQAGPTACRIAYKSSPGPFGFKPQQLGAAIAQALAMQASK